MPLFNLPDLALVDPALGTEDQINHCFLECREYWVTPERCTEVVNYCNVVEKYLKKSNSPLPALLETTRYEATMRRDTLLRMKLDSVLATYLSI